MKLINQRDTFSLTRFTPPGIGYILLLGVGILFLQAITACVPAATLDPAPPDLIGNNGIVVDPPHNGSASPTAFQPLPPTSTYTPQPSLTLPPPATITPTPTDTPLPIPTATWSDISAGDVVVPILLYHHVLDQDTPNRYVVSVDQFEAQMKKLHDWDYTPIPISLLVEVLVNGGKLPPRPVVITFDDGDVDIYENAFPIMKKRDFPGVFFIVSSRLGAESFTSVDQLKEMISAGWEIGSHGRNHLDLTLDHSIVRDEVLQSRLDLEDALGVPVKTFAYPYGLMDGYALSKVEDYGYRAAVGLGTSNEHTWNTIYYLNRREVKGDYDLDAFATLLPWAGKLKIHKSASPTPTPTP